MKFFNTKGKYENCFFYLFAIFSLIYGIIIASSNNLDGIRIFNSNASSYILIGVSGLLIIAETIFLTVYKNQSLKKIFYTITILIFCIVVADILICGI